MRVPKDNIVAKIALRYESARIWFNPFAAIVVLLGVFARKTRATKTEVFLGVPVYFIETWKDLSLGSAILKDSAVLLSEKSPYWAKEVKTVFSNVMVQGLGPMYYYERRDRGWILNPLKFGSLRGEKAAVIMTMGLITAMCLGMLYRGRFGYFGIKHAHSIGFSAVARFLRKCNTNGDYSDQLSWCYKRMDKLRPGRNYYQRFMLETNLEKIG